MAAPIACEWRDVQGTVVSGYRRLLYARYLVLTIADATLARVWLASLLPVVTVAEGRHSNIAINIAFAHDGVARLLGLEATGLQNFGVPFVEGMTAHAHRRLILGDVGVNDPSSWAWGGPGNRPAHVLLMLFATREAELDHLATTLLASGSGLEVAARIDTYRPTDKEPFGFADGLSQPILEGTRSAAENPDSLHAIRLGEILCGYPDNAGVIEPAPAVEGCPEFGINGTYLVARQLAQDVDGFWKFMAAAAAPLGIGKEALAEKVVGRAMSGDPLRPDRPPHRCADTNEFGFRDEDPRGEGCPIGSHVRRGNPRDMLGDTAADSWRTVNRHRLIRRGRPYVVNGKAAGLVFVGLNADIERQFEFVQQNWINDTGFGELRHERDPLVGWRAGADDTFTIPGTPLRRRVPNMQSFVTTTGGAYFFLPGMRALAHMAGL